MTIANFEGSDDASFENTQAADPSSINEESNIALSVFPNPIQSDAKLSFSLTKPSNVRLDILNVLGETILSNAYSLQAGNNSININVDKMTNGIYFAHLSINGEINTVKITVSK
ncbi:T9SS type A sorting domain-containing protein [Flavobacteriales bacterium]|nr:T9SS type A sorting domain-containing protein [Flavobacteriales bacterium]